MIRLLIVAATILCSQFNAASQSNVIQGDQLLTLLNRSTADPLFTTLKSQNGFRTDALSGDWSVYVVIKDALIKEIELRNGGKSSSGLAYGVYKKQLPLGLTWNITEAEANARFGEPVNKSEKYNFREYVFKNNRVRFTRDSGRITMIRFGRPGTDMAGAKPPAGTPLLQMSGGITTVDWSVVQHIINSFPNLMNLASKDSTDYIGQVYYKPIYPSVGMERAAVKRKKQTGQTWYEAFYKITTKDTLLVQRTFAGLYRGFDTLVKQYAPVDFVFAAVTKDNFSRGNMNWLAGWTLNSVYDKFKPGLGKVRITLLLSGLKNYLEPEKIDYTIKVHIHDRDVAYDFFTWDTPR